jgi:hypothetical protein
MEEMKKLQAYFNVLRDQIGDSSHDREMYSQLSEICLQIMNGEDLRDTMMSICAAFVSSKNFDTLMKIMVMTNNLFIQSINKEENERSTNKNSESA